MRHDQLVSALSETIGPRYVLHRPEELLLYAYDGSTLDPALPQLVVLPGSTEEVAAVVRLAAAAGYPIVARGAGTGLSGGSVPSAGGMVVALTRLNRIMQINPVERTAEVQAGVVNLDLSMQAAPYGLHFAPDPSSRRASTIGGNVAANAGGPHCLKYGVTANHVPAATVVLSDGSIVRLGSAAPDAPGYDLLGAFIGSEGTFGIVTDFTVLLTPVGEEVRTLLAVYDDLDAAGRSVTAIMAAGILPATMELMENLGVRMLEEQMHVGYPADARAVLLIEIDGLHEEFGAASATAWYPLPAAWRMRSTAGPGCRRTRATLGRAQKYADGLYPGCAALPYSGCGGAAFAPAGDDPPLRGDCPAL